MWRPVVWQMYAEVLAECVAFITACTHLPTYNGTQEVRHWHLGDIIILLMETFPNIQLQNVRK